MIPVIMTGSTSVHSRPIDVQAGMRGARLLWEDPDV